MFVGLNNSVLEFPVDGWWWFTDNVSTDLDNITFTSNHGVLDVTIQINLGCNMAVQDDHWNSRLRRFGNRSSGIAGVDSELVCKILSKTSNCVGGIRDVGEVTLEPTSIWALTALNNVSGDMRSTVVVGLKPFDGNRSTVGFDRFDSERSSALITCNIALILLRPLRLANNVFSANAEGIDETSLKASDLHFPVTADTSVSRSPVEGVAILKFDVISENL